MPSEGKGVGEHRRAKEAEGGLNRVHAGRVGAGREKGHDVLGLETESRGGQYESFPAIISMGSATKRQNINKKVGTSNNADLPLVYRATETDGRM